MEKNKTGKYFKYAIGEIILVVIGILIALSINNWNEDRKTKTYEKQVYTQIYKDIKADSLNLSLVINFYKQKDTLMNRILHDSVPSIAYDTINNKNQFTFPYGIRLITNSDNVTNTKKGYQLFKTFNTIGIESDSLSFSIEDYYSKAIINENYEEVRNATDRNIAEFQQKDWFLDLAVNHKLNLDYLDYINNSRDFKIRVFDYQLFAIKNYNRDLIQQQELAEIIKERIKNRLEK
ncbi:DUF6090 family protein [Winogradskyella immobilis]|uniref:Uncharacterized protein n=1 Tax=Winogradskyella immobilis TaxID=2816852 RepID=A0ABS8ERZ7_9FLAO|nr:DUF6090 family protein [Winogradskyella immobilis]MCC1485666.1 hypothetical protein [Winogradskyella immobilis]MCG0017760.1 hypothetical protein [Winogradskyella immobilis]